MRREGAMITLYADILFIINFAMDYLSLYIAYRITGKAVSIRRSLCSAAVGAFIGTLSTTLYINRSSTSYVRFIVGFTASTVMTLIAFGRKGRSFSLILRESIILWGAGTAVVGVVSLITSFGSAWEHIRMESGRSGAEAFAEIFVISSAVSCILIRLFSSNRVSSGAKETADISFTLNGVNYKAVGLFDSGNNVREPISGLPVIIVCAKIMGDDGEKYTGGAYSDLAYNIHMRVIPIKGVAGEKLLYGFIPDELYINRHNVKAVIAIDENESFMGNSALIPSVLYSDKK